MGEQTPKQFLELKGKPVLYYTINAFLKAYEDIRVILVLPSNHISKGRELIDTYFDKEKIQITAGGITRFHSVKNGLQMVKPDAVIFVHDGVRCLLSTDLIHRCYEKAAETGSAVPVIPSRDSIRLISPEGNEAVDRNTVMLVQTPQTFQGSILLPAFQADYDDKFTDEATVVEAYGLKLSLVEGEENNIKITNPLDLIIAEKILEEN